LGIIYHFCKPSCDFMYWFYVLVMTHKRNIFYKYCTCLFPCSFTLIFCRNLVWSGTVQNCIFPEGLKYLLGLLRHSFSSAMWSLLFPGMGCNHYPVSSVRVLFCLGHFVALGYPYKSYVSSADSGINLARERIGTSTEIFVLSSFLYYRLR